MGLFYKSFTIVIYDPNDMANTVNLNNDHEALASVVNYNCKRDVTIWCANLTSSFTMVICL